MLEESPRIAEVAALAIAGIGVAIVVYSILFRRNIFIMTFGALIGTCALVAPMLLRDQPISVLVIRGTNDGIEIVRDDAFNGGTYKQADDQKITIERQPNWGRVATVIVNDSTHLVRIVGFSYSESGLGVGGATSIAIIPPGGRSAIAVTPSGATPESVAPPKTITAHGPFYSLVIAQWTLAPYDTDRHDSIESLRDGIEIGELVYENIDPPQRQSPNTQR